MTGFHVDICDIFKPSFCNPGLALEESHLQSIKDVGIICPVTIVFLPSRAKKRKEMTYYFVESVV